MLVYFLNEHLFQVQTGFELVAQRKSVQLIQDQ